jgi:hypothetical protein
MSRASECRRAVGIAVALVLSLGAAGCGGGGKKESGPTEPPTVAQDERAIARMIVDYGAVERSGTCDFLSEGFLRELGGRAACHKRHAKTEAVKYTTGEVLVKRDRGEITVDPPGEGPPISYPVIRAGDANDKYGGWKVVGAAEDLEPPELALAFQKCLDRGGLEGAELLAVDLARAVTYERGDALLKTLFFKSEDAALAFAEKSENPEILRQVGAAIQAGGGLERKQANLALDCAESVQGGRQRIDSSL